MALPPRSDGRFANPTITDGFEVRCLRMAEQTAPRSLEDHENSTETCTPPQRINVRTGRGGRSDPAAGYRRAT